MSTHFQFAMCANVCVICYCIAKISFGFRQNITLSEFSKKKTTFCSRSIENPLPRNVISILFDTIPSLFLPLWNMSNVFVSYLFDKSIHSDRKTGYRTVTLHHHETSSCTKQMKKKTEQFSTYKGNKMVFGTFERFNLQLH